MRWHARHRSLGQAVLVTFAVAFSSASAPGLAPKSLAAYGAACNGRKDDSLAIRRSLFQQGSAIAPSGRTCLIDPPSRDGVTVGAGQTVTAEKGGGFIGGAMQRQMFRITGNHGGVENADIDLNGGNDGVIVAGTITLPVIAPYVRNNHFHGRTNRGGAYEYFDGDSDGKEAPGRYGIVSALSEGNTQDQRDGSTASYNIVAEATDGFVSRNDRCLNDNGFCLQTRWARNSQIKNLIAAGIDYGTTQTSTESLLIFKIAAPASHCSVISDGHVVALGLSGCVGTGTTVTVSGAKAGQRYRLVAFRSLEAININSGSVGTSIIGGMISGRGDNGITFGADYHWMEGGWTSGGATISDMPTGNAVKGVRIDNTFYASIGTDADCTDITLDSNNLSRFGLGVVSGSSEDAFAAGITLTYASAARSCVSNVGRNVIDNSYGQGKYGISINGYPASFGIGPQLINLTQQEFRGRYANEYQLPTSATAMTCSIRRSDRPLYPHPIQSSWNKVTSGGAPSPTPLWTYSVSGSGWAQGPSIERSDQRSMQTIPGSYVDQSPASRPDQFSGKIFDFTFWAKSSQKATEKTASYVAIIGRSAAGNFPACSLAVTSTSWTRYEMSVALSGVESLYSIRIGAPENGVAADFRNPYLETQEIG